MVNGISIFREHFSNFKDQYTVIIGELLQHEMFERMKVTFFLTALEHDTLMSCFM